MFKNHGNSSIYKTINYSVFIFRLFSSKTSLENNNYSKSLKSKISPFSLDISNQKI